MQIGVDKLMLTTKEFSVKNNHNLRVKQGDILPSGEVLETHLFNEQLGVKAYHNDSLYNLTISPYNGISTAAITLNPSKTLHPYNLTNSNKEIEGVINHIRKDLITNVGVNLPINKEMSVSRLDIAKQGEMNLPISMYAPLFRSLRGKRKNTKEHPSSHYYSNKSNEINFYDKSAAITYEYEKKKLEMPTLKDKYLRGEMRMLKRKSVGNIMRFNDLQTFFDSGETYRSEKYTEYINNQLFKGANAINQTQLFAFDYDKNLAFLKHIKAQMSRGGINYFISSFGIETMLQNFGSLENIRQLFLDAGYNRTYSYEAMNRIQEKMHQASFFFGDSKEENVTKMYNEVFMKFAV